MPCTRRERWHHSPLILWTTCLPTFTTRGWHWRHHSWQTPDPTGLSAEWGNWPRGSAWLYCTGIRWQRHNLHYSPGTENYLNDNKISIRDYQQLSSTLTSRGGIPQGAVVGPILITQRRHKQINLWYDTRLWCVTRRLWPNLTALSINIVPLPMGRTKKNNN